MKRANQTILRLLLHVSNIYILMKTRSEARRAAVADVCVHRSVLYPRIYICVYSIHEQKVRIDIHGGSETRAASSQ